jgi:hypothetical protein
MQIDVRDLSVLTFAQLEALAACVKVEQTRRWRQFAENPSLFRDVAAEMPTEWLVNLVEQGVWGDKWASIEQCLCKVNMIALAELDRREQAAKEDVLSVANQEDRDARLAADDWDPDLPF